MTPAPDCGDAASRRGPSPPVVAVAVLGLLALGGCGASRSLLGTTSSTPVSSAAPTSAPGSAPSTTVPVNGEVAVAFPVVACTNSAAGNAVLKSRSGWNPSILLAPVPTSLVGKVTFYSDGTHMLLGPSGWTCSTVTNGTTPAGGTPTTTTPGAFGTPTTTASTVPPTTPTSGPYGAIGAPGGTTLAVYPDNDPVPPTTGPPAPGTEGIFATYATTGSKAGIDIVCPYFTIPSWQSQSAGCSTAKPAGETTDVLTPDVTEITDPAGVVGNVAASGGQTVTTGVVLFPQVPAAVSYGSAVAVATESCAIPTTALCPTILSDFEVREFPVPAAG